MPESESHFDQNIPQSPTQPPDMKTRAVLDRLFRERFYEFLGFDGQTEFMKLDQKEKDRQYQEWLSKNRAN